MYLVGRYQVQQNPILFKWCFFPILNYFLIIFFSNIPFVCFFSLQLTLVDANLVNHRLQFPTTPCLFEFEKGVPWTVNCMSHYLCSMEALKFKQVENSAFFCQLSVSHFTTQLLIFLLPSINSTMCGLFCFLQEQMVWIRRRILALHVLDIRMVDKHR